MYKNRGFGKFSIKLISNDYNHFFNNNLRVRRFLTYYWLKLIKEESTTFRFVTHLLFKKIKRFFEKNSIYSLDRFIFWMAGNFKIYTKIKINFNIFYYQLSNFLKVFFQKYFYFNKNNITSYVFFFYKKFLTLIWYFFNLNSYLILDMHKYFFLKKKINFNFNFIFFKNFFISPLVFSFFKQSAFQFFLRNCIFKYVRFFTFLLNPFILFFKNFINWFYFLHKELISFTSFRHFVQKYCFFVKFFKNKLFPLTSVFSHKYYFFKNTPLFYWNFIRTIRNSSFREFVCLYIKWFQKINFFLFESTNYYHISAHLKRIDKKKSVNFTKRLTYLYFNRGFEWTFDKHHKNTFFIKRLKFLYSRNFFFKNRANARGLFFNSTLQRTTKLITFLIIFQFYKSLFWRFFYMFAGKTGFIESKFIFLEQQLNQHFSLQQLYHTDGIHTFYFNKGFFYKTGYYGMGLWPEKDKSTPSDIIYIKWKYDLQNTCGFDYYWFITHRLELSIGYKNYIDWSNYNLVGDFYIW